MEVQAWDVSDSVAEEVKRLRSSIESVFLGKSECVEFVLVALLARGHVLLEDVPGVGKTTLARAVAGALDLSFQRIQFTSDMLPADILGISVYKEEEGDFVFKPGPIFANLVLADEINRTTPRTQSSLLEAMNEGQVTLDGVTHSLDKPFVVMATQNPLEFAGTYPLPESQMDRFLVRINIGYPDPEHEREVIRRYGDKHAWESVEASVTREDVFQMQEAVSKIHVSDDVMDYVLRLAHATRTSPGLELGVSTRGAMALCRATKARAYLYGRDYVIPDDVKKLAVAVMSHRVIPTGNASLDRRQNEMVIQDILDNTESPV